MLGVGTGAFGAHGLRAHVTPDMLAIWQTAVMYQLVHALGLLAIAALRPLLGAGVASMAAACLLVGLGGCRGSVYALAVTGVRGIGATTAVGGVLFLVGWLLLAAAALRAPRVYPRRTSLAP